MATSDDPGAEWRDCLRLVDEDPLCSLPDARLPPSFYPGMQIGAWKLHKETPSIQHEGVVTREPRVVVKDKLTQPGNKYSGILKLITTFQGPNNAVWTMEGTAFYIGDSLATTAAHLTFHPKLGPAKRAFLYPDERSGANVGGIACIAIAVHAKWMKCHQRENDFCIVTIAEGSDLGIRPLPFVDLPANPHRYRGKVIGFPSDLPVASQGFQLIECQGSVSIKKARTVVMIEHKVNTAAGSSGSPLFDPSNTNVVGIHCLFDREANQNYAVPINQNGNDVPQFKAVLRFMRGSGVTPAKSNSYLRETTFKLYHEETLQFQTRRSRARKNNKDQIQIEEKEEEEADQEVTDDAIFVQFHPGFRKSSLDDPLHIVIGPGRTTFRQSSGGGGIGRHHDDNPDHDGDDSPDGDDNDNDDDDTCLGAPFPIRIPRTPYEGRDNVSLWIWALTAFVLGAGIVVWTAMIRMSLSHGLGGGGGGTNDDNSSSRRRKAGSSATGSTQIVLEKLPPSSSSSSSFIQRATPESQQQKNQQIGPTFITIPSDIMLKNMTLSFIETFTPILSLFDEMLVVASPPLRDPFFFPNDEGEFEEEMVGGGGGPESVDILCRGLAVKSEAMEKYYEKYRHAQQRRRQRPQQEDIEDALFGTTGKKDRRQQEGKTETITISRSLRHRLEGVCALAPPKAPPQRRDKPPRRSRPGARSPTSRASSGRGWC
ncbi:hypothetical protein F5B21DRAFT_519980 [Xylaria acuta]|nr:hypothetical protein F5B21DRAFT_519980 [Xylaria acuta]